MKIDLLPLIIKKKIQIFSFVAFWVIIGIFYAIFSTPLYNSYVTLYPSSNETPIGSMGDLGGMLSQFQDLGGLSSDLSGTAYDIKDLVESDTFKQRIVKHKWKIGKDSINLIEYWELDENNYDGFFSSIKKRLFALRTDDLNLIRLDNAKGILEKRIEVVEKESGLFTINILMEDAVLASQIADYTADEIERYIKSKSNEKAKENRKFIEQQKDSAYKDLEESENNLKQFLVQNKVSEIDGSPKLKFENLSLGRKLEINQELYLLLLKEFKISEIEELKDQEIVQRLDDAYPATRKTKPNLFIVLIVMFNFSFIGIVLFYFVYENYLRKILKNT